MSTKFKVDVSAGDISINKNVITVKGKEGQLETGIRYPFLKVKREGDQLMIETEKDIAYQKAIAGTLAAEVRNMIIGVNEKFTAELELIYMHFPATMKVAGEKLVVENFVGERKPREINLPKGVEVKVSGTKIKISGISRYLVGQV
ncbi:50S ribosomal protein L6, partial [Candidatus Parvarchaeota archaeon]|nr:50S ribosomal protein L6 [Candidatus Parvarchaeota archaeon]